MKKNFKNLFEIKRIILFEKIQKERIKKILRVKNLEKEFKKQMFGIKI